MKPSRLAGDPGGPLSHQEWTSSPFFPCPQNSKDETHGVDEGQNEITVFMVLGRGAVGTWMAANGATKPIQPIGLQELLSDSFPTRVLNHIQTSTETSPLGRGNAPKKIVLEIWVAFKAWQLQECFRGIRQFLKPLTLSQLSRPIGRPLEIRFTFFQNGLGITDAIRKEAETLLLFDPSHCVRFYRGFVWTGFRLKEVVPTGPTNSPFTAPREAEILGKLQVERTLLEGAENVHKAQETEWRKGLVNAVINPIGALYGLNNGQILRNPLALKRAKDLCSAVLGAAHCQGFLKDLDEQGAWKVIEAVCINNSENRNSMLQDIEAGRKTEWNFLLPFVQNALQSKSWFTESQRNQGVSKFSSFSSENIQILNTIVDEFADKFLR